MADLNPFLGRLAEQYASGRPYYHPVMMERIAGYLQLNERVEHAVDVGCGTGLSSFALAAIAQKVTGFDVSAEMLASALLHPRVEYHMAPADDLPLQAASCDLMTLASVFHWLDRDAFLAEARRVLRPGALLVIYDSRFRGQMEGNPAFAGWHREYLERFPSPARARRSPFGPEDARQAGFQWQETERFEHSFAFSEETLRAYLLSQSNAAAEPDAVSLWLNDRLPALFQNGEDEEFRFRAEITFLQRPR
jgi:ubiquinone/menaquinone biosynthesis C-methylase UbiE